MQALLFGLATGLSVGAGLALLLDSLDDTVRRPDDLVALWVIPPAAVVDHVPRGDREGPARGRLLLRDDTRPGAEALRILRANVRLAQPGARCRTLVVTSAADGEGKSFIACNLALAFAQANERVLLVDANLRSPSVQQAFGVTPEAGLQQAIDSIDARRWKAPTPNGNHARPLAERAARLSARAVPGARAVAADPVAADDSPIPGIVPSGVENLWLLVAAPTLSDPASVLGSTAAIQLMHELGRRWDIVILDTASLLPVADARLLAASADAVLVVARAGSTRRSALRSCIAMLEQAGRPPIGVVLNASAVEHPARRRKLRVLPEFR
jgi:Mrp family chromosome partitioning ATPase